VPEQRLMSPEIRRRWRRSYGTVLGKTLIDLGFSVGRLLMSMDASVLVDSVGPPSAKVCRAAASFP
jgi:hypothetical protein